MTETTLDPAPPPSEPRFGAARAFIVLVFVFGAQAIASAAIIVVGLIAAVAKGASPADPRVVKNITDSAITPIALASALASAFALVLVARWSAGHLFRDSTPNGIGWRTKSSSGELLLAALAGGAIGAVYCGLTMLLPAAPDTPMGPFSSMAAAGGWSRFVWMLIAIVLAPPVEEVLFRGLLLKGLTVSWGPRVAYVVVTVLFVAFHLFETFRYPLAIIGITTLAVGVLVARVRTGSLYPAMALHAAYNAILVIWVYVPMSKK